jgi:hypothetical protein
MSGPVDVRGGGGEPGVSKEDIVTFRELGDVELPFHESLIDLDDEHAKVRDFSILGVASVSGSDVEGFREFMGRDFVFSYEHPADECSSCSGVDNGGGLQQFSCLFGREESHRDS